jgi:hypothetical protein
VAPGREQEFEALCAELDVTCTKLGVAEGKTFTLAPMLEISLAEIEESWTTGLEPRKSIDR